MENHTLSVFTIIKNMTGHIFYTRFWLQDLKMNVIEDGVTEFFFDVHFLDEVEGSVVDYSVGLEYPVCFCFFFVFFYCFVACKSIKYFVFFVFAKRTK